MTYSLRAMRTQEVWRRLVVQARHASTLFALHRRCCSLGALPAGHDREGREGREERALHALARTDFSRDGAGEWPTEMAVSSNNPSAGVCDVLSKRS